MHEQACCRSGKILSKNASRRGAFRTDMSMSVSCLCHVHACTRESVYVQIDVYGTNRRAEGVQIDVYDTNRRAEGVA